MKKLILSLTLTSAASAVSANSCYQESPDLAASGDDYYNIEVDAKTDRAARKQLRKVYPLLEGEWSGKLTEMLCKGPEREPRIEYRHYQLDSKVRAGSNGSLHIQSDRHWVEERRRQQISRHLFGPDGAYKLISSSDNHIEVSYKFRGRAEHYRGKVEHYDPTLLNPFRKTTKTITSSNSIFREQITRLERTEQGLRTTLAHYINGVLVSTETALSKKK